MRRCETPSCNTIVVGLGGSGAVKRFCDECAKERIRARSRRQWRENPGRFKKTSGNVMIGAEKPSQLCTAIGCYNPKGKGLRFLCDACYGNRTNDVEYEHGVNSSSMVAGAF